MTPTQREAALRLVDELSRPHCDLGQQEAAALLRELLAEPQGDPTVKDDLLVGPKAFYKASDAEPAYAQYARGYNDGFATGLREARLAAANEPQGEPVAWHVCSVNSDGSLSLEFAAPWEELAHEHVNDAINEHDIDGAASWVVRPVYASPQPQQTEPSQNTHPPQQRKPLTDEQVWNLVGAKLDDSMVKLKDVLPIARAIERAHGIGEKP